MYEIERFTQNAFHAKAHIRRRHSDASRLADSLPRGLLPPISADLNKRTRSPRRDPIHGPSTELGLDS